MEKTAVTIVMPAYRAERYIGEAVASVLAQTCPDWELLVVVDASPDESAAAAEKAAAGDPRVRILRLPANVGVAEARMAGVREAKTAWVAFLDSDDAWTPEKLERQLAFAEKTGADLVFTGSGFMDEEGKRIDKVLHDLLPGTSEAESDLLFLRACEERADAAVSDAADRKPGEGTHARGFRFLAQDAAGRRESLWN